MATVAPATRLASVLASLAPLAAGKSVAGVRLSSILLSVEVGVDGTAEAEGRRFADLVVFAPEGLFSSLLDACNLSRLAHGGEACSPPFSPPAPSPRRRSST